MTFASLILTLVGLGFLYAIVPYLIRKRQTRQLAGMCARLNAISLTYDDGPGPILTPRLLDVLRGHNLHATFYALGRNIDANPHLLQRALAEGHQVGSHTFDHKNAWKSDPVSFAIDVQKGIQCISRHGGDVLSFRPPFGKLTLFALLHGYMRGLRYGWWTVDSQDSWARRSIDSILEELVQKNGGVVLMHDFDTYAKAPPGQSHPDFVIDLTEAIIQLAQAKGYRIVPLRDLEK